MCVCVCVCVCGGGFGVRYIKHCYGVCIRAGGGWVERRGERKRDGDRERQTDRETGEGVDREVVNNVG